MKPSDPGPRPRCTVVGILDDGWRGLSEAPATACATPGW
jgi:hypothetical protein